MPHNLPALLPVIILAATSLVTLLAIAVHRTHRVVAILTMLGFLAALIVQCLFRLPSPRAVTPLLVSDHFATLYTALLLATGVVLTVISFTYWEQQAETREEFYVLLMLAVLGAAILVASSHFASFFLGLEILSVALYGLVAYRQTSLPGLEAGIKYLTLAGISSAFLLFGMALIYSDLGTMQLYDIASQLTANPAVRPVLLAGFGMMLVGIGFKLAVFPFHLWTPDIYEGAPVPAAALIATVSKGAMFALLLRYFTALQLITVMPFAVIFPAIAIASMCTGNLLALQQRNLKRVLAYSSIAHMGYLLVAFFASGALGETAVFFYLTAYFVAILAIFAVMAVLANADQDADRPEVYHGLAWRHPWLAGVLTVALLSLAGIPFTAGFIGKFFVLTAGIGGGLWVLALVLVLNSGLGVYYYLRIVVDLFRSQRQEEGAHKVAMTPHKSISLQAGAMLAILALLLIGLGTYPAPLLRIIQQLLIVPN